MFNIKIRKGEDNVFVKAQFNVTYINYLLIKLKNGELVTEKHVETMLHKRTESNVKNHLSKIVKSTNSVGFDIIDVKTEKVVSEIPYEVALRYKF